MPAANAGLNSQQTKNWVSFDEPDMGANPVGGGGGGFDFGQKFDFGEAQPNASGFDFNAPSSGAPSGAPDKFEF